MTKTIDGDAVINSILLTDQGSNPSAPGAGKKQLFTKASGLYFIDNNGAVSGPLGNFLTPGGRLTLTSGTAVTTADVTSATSIWYQPKVHNICPVWDGSKVIPLEFDATQLSLSGLSGTASFDVFGYSNAGVFALDYAMWTSPTTRAVPLIYQSGRLVKSGTPTRTYLGSFYSATGGQTDDTGAKRFVWNYYNRISRRIDKSDTTQHTYNSATPRYWNNDNTQIAQIMVGVVEDDMTFSLNVKYDCAAGKETFFVMDIDAATAADTTLPQNILFCNAYAAMTIGATKQFIPALGYHFYSMLEYSTAGAANTFFYYYLTGSVLG